MMPTTKTLTQDKNRMTMAIIVIVEALRCKPSTPEELIAKIKELCGDNNGLLIDASIILAATLPHQPTEQRHE